MPAVVEAAGCNTQAPSRRHVFAQPQQNGTNAATCSRLLAATCLLNRRRSTASGAKSQTRTSTSAAQPDASSAGCFVTVSARCLWALCLKNFCTACEAAIVLAPRFWLHASGENVKSQFEGGAAARLSAHPVQMKSARRFNHSGNVFCY